MVDDFEPSKEASAQIKKTLEVMGFFIHSFAAVELLVVCWLLGLSKTRQAARQYLKKEQRLAERIKRLKELVKADTKLTASTELLKVINDIEPLRRFRNQVAHAPAGVSSNNEVSLVGYRKTIPISPQIISDHTQRAGRIMVQLNDYHLKRFGLVPSLQVAAEAAPPPID